MPGQENLDQDSGMTVITNIDEHREKGIPVDQVIYVLREAINNKILIILQDEGYIVFKNDKYQEHISGKPGMVGHIFAPEGSEIRIQTAEGVKNTCINLSISGMCIEGEKKIHNTIKHGISVHTSDIDGDVSITWAENSHNENITGNATNRNTRVNATNINVTGNAENSNIGGKAINHNIGGKSIRNLKKDNGVWKYIPLWMRLYADSLKEISNEYEEKLEN